jgi:RNA polymerase sigma-70 factor (ECF subfamily)
MRSEDDRRADDELERRVAQLLAERQLEAAYLIIVERLGPGVRGYLHALTRQEAQADDLFQALRVTLWESLPRLAEHAATTDGAATSSVRAWLYRSARNRAIDWLRRHSRNNVPLPSGASDLIPAPGQSSAARRRERLELLGKVLGELTESERDVYILRAERGLSFKEIGEVLGVADTAAKERYQRAKERLKRLVGKLTADRA